MILQLETSDSVCSAALTHEGKLLALREDTSGFTHAENLAVFVQQLLKDEGCIHSDLKAVAVSKGPGSFTGLRIGVAMAKGLCFGFNIPLIAVNTLEAMVYGAKQKYDEDIFFCPMIDARRMEVYTAVYDFNLQEINTIEALILQPDSFQSVLNNKRILFWGSGASKWKSLCTHPNALFDNELSTSAAYLTIPAQQKFMAASFESLAYFEPYYLKEFYAPTKLAK